MIGLSVIVPTVGRPSLLATLNSAIPQLTTLDQIVVVYDGSDLDMEPAYEALKDAECDWAICRIENLGAYGHPARNYALDHVVNRTRVMSIDDDDVYLPGAFDVVREALSAHRPAVHVFGCRWGPGHPAHGAVLPRGRGLLLGEIGTPMICAPCCTARFGASYSGDHTYAVELAAIFGDFVWHTDVICEVRPAPEPVAVGGEG